MHLVGVFFFFFFFGQMAIKITAGNQVWPNFPLADVLLWLGFFFTFWLVISRLCKQQQERMFVKIFYVDIFRLVSGAIVVFWRVLYSL